MGERAYRIGINLLPIVPGGGGIRTHVRGLLAGLEELDPPDDIVLFVNKEFDPDVDASIEVVETSARGSIRPWRYGYEQLCLPWQIRRKDLDVLHCPGYAVPLATDTPTVVTIHDLNYEAVPETFTRRSRFIWKRIVPRSAAASDAVLSISSFSQEEIHRHLGIPRSKIGVVPNAPSPTLPASPPSLDSMDVPVDPPYLLYVGSTHPHKNHETLLRALPELPEEITLVFVGPERSAHEDVVDLMHSMGLENRVDMLGFVSEETLAALYDSAKLYVHPSQYEGFGMPVLEAMHYGTPVACADSASLPEVGDNAAAYFDPFSPGDIASTCMELLESEDRRETLTERGRQHVVSYSWRDIVAKTLSTCRDVAS